MARDDWDSRTVMTEFWDTIEGANKRMIDDGNLRQGQRVRLTVDLENGRLPAGATGYLNRGGWEGAQWGVVFDHEAHLDMRTTHVQAENADGARVRIVDVVELIDDDRHNIY
jgi:hypothetical protein